MLEERNYEIVDVHKLIGSFIEDQQLTVTTDIFQDSGLVGNDFHKLILQYSKTFNVDMTNYLWYFHSDEEGLNFIGRVFFKPPHERVNRIPVTPQLLLQYAKTGTWTLSYPEHSIPKKRYDLMINTGLLILITVMIIWFLFSLGG